MSVVPRIMARNWRLKLAAVGLSVFLWALVRTAPDSTATSVPARVVVEMRPDASWVTARPPDPPEVRLHVRGTFGDVDRLRRAGTSIRVPLGDIGGGDTMVTLRPSWAQVESGVSVERVDPAQVHLAFEEAASAAKPLYLRPTGELPEDLALAQPLSLTPLVVRVRGPESLVERVDSIPTLGPDLSAVDGSDVVEVPLDTVGYPGLSFATTTASVSIRVEEAVERVLEAVPAVIAGTPGEVPVSELALEPPLVQVTLRGGRTRVGQAAVPELRAEVDAAFVETMQPGESRSVPLRLQGVPDLVDAVARPDSVRVRRRGGGAPPDGTDPGGAGGPVPGSGRAGAPGAGP